MKLPILTILLLLAVHQIDADPRLVIVITDAEPENTLQARESTAIAGHEAFKFTATESTSTCDFEYQVTSDFTVNGTGGAAGTTGQGTVYYARTLDYEVLSVYSIELTVYEPCNMVNTATTDVNFFLLDDNDNTPYFEQQIIAIYKNEGPGENLLVTTIKSKDGDNNALQFGTNSIVFSLTDDYEGLLILEDKGIATDGWAVTELHLTRDLDFEEGLFYQVFVTATDCKQGSCDPILTGTSTILITVKDADDQPPRFTVYTPYTEIPENAAVETTVTSIQAVDGDIGIKNKIQYSLTNDWYQIDPNSGEITVKASPDREGTGYQDYGTVLTITATEDSTQKLSSTVQITVGLTDINDNVPTFSSPTYSGTVTESAVTCMNVALDKPLKVEDKDTEQYASYTVSIEESVPFIISPNEGTESTNFAIFVNGVLDYETQISYTFTLKATDKEPGGLTSTSSVTITVQDSDESNQSFKVTVDCDNLHENPAVGTKVCTNKATSTTIDNETIKFVALYGPFASGITLDRDSGDMTINDSTPFDFETMKIFSFVIETRDNYGLGNSVIADYSAKLGDSNDNPPRFLSSNREGVMFNLAQDFISPFVVQAVDADTEVPVAIAYSLLPNGNEGHFQIVPGTVASQSVALIKPIRPLDMSSILTCDNTDDCSLQLRVQASDGLHKTEEIFTVRMLNCYCFKNSSQKSHGIASSIHLILAAFFLAIVNLV